ncbi:HAMP domain-containing sensor histidine kinase [Lactobacillus sp.]|uniref:sensor histidine kinase n=1 Tax=Lactobacillus sp. TaxID=1591 RepID=UPI001987D665|nr:HAMP domain-containing sensor histidine kinase [Lactobacillus sp.]MBD5429407.1 HAMP domain-containing histidine kinase [Lactobacillus sp.]MBD5430841.1 HAMP domain-containing histidine kinase [Lactobacillus sp.]
MTKKTRTTAQQLTSLFLKLFIAILFIVNLAFVIISTIFVYQTAQKQAHELIENVKDNVEERGHHDHDNIKWDTLLDAYIARQDDDAIKIVTPKEKTFYSEDGDKLFKKVDTSRHYNNVFFASRSVYYLEQSNVWGYKVTVALNVDGLFQLVIQLLITMIVLNLGAILLCIPLIRRFAKKWSFSLEKMDHEILQIQNNNKSQNKTISVPQQPVEIKHLAQSFNSLLDSQYQAMQREHQFVTDASHELKTPIAAIRGHVGLIKRRGKSNPEIIDKSLEYIDSESLRMQELVNELLELGRGQGKSAAIEKIDLVGVIKNECELIWQEFHRHVQLKSPNELFYAIKLTDFRHLIHNLLENAAKYSQKGTPIFLSLKSKNKGLVLKVKDEGQGIKKENYNKIFDRFFREDQAHSNKISGTGLGLAIVKKVVDEYHGQIKLSANHPNGMIFTIYLPYEK